MHICHIPTQNICMQELSSFSLYLCVLSCKGNSNLGFLVFAVLLWRREALSGWSGRGGSKRFDLSTLQWYFQRQGSEHCISWLIGWFFHYAILTTFQSFHYTSTNQHYTLLPKKKSQYIRTVKENSCILMKKKYIYTCININFTCKWIPFLYHRIAPVMALTIYSTNVATAAPWLCSIVSAPPTSVTLATATIQPSMTSRHPVCRSAQQVYTLYKYSITGCVQVWLIWVIGV